MVRQRQTKKAERRQQGGAYALLCINSKDVATGRRLGKDEHNCREMGGGACEDK